MSLRVFSHSLKKENGFLMVVSSEPRVYLPTGPPENPLNDIKEVPNHPLYTHPAYLLLGKGTV